MNYKLAMLVALATSACDGQAGFIEIPEPDNKGLELCASVDVSSVTFEGDTLRDPQVVRLTNTADCEIMAAFDIQASLDDPLGVFNLEFDAPVVLEPTETTSFVLRFVGEGTGQFEAQLELGLLTDFAESTRRVQLFANNPPEE